MNTMIKILIIFSFFFLNINYNAIASQKDSTQNIGHVGLRFPNATEVKAKIKNFKKNNLISGWVASWIMITDSLGSYVQVGIIKEDNNLYKSKYFIQYKKSNQDRVHIENFDNIVNFDSNVKDINDFEIKISQFGLVEIQINKIKVFIDVLNTTLYNKNAFFSTEASRVGIDLETTFSDCFYKNSKQNNWIPAFEDKNIEYVLGNGSGLIKISNIEIKTVRTFTKENQNNFSTRYSKNIKSIYNDDGEIKINPQTEEDYYQEKKENENNDLLTNKVFKFNQDFDIVKHFDNFSSKIETNYKNIYIENINIQKEKEVELDNKYILFSSFLTYNTNKKEIYPSLKLAFLNDIGIFRYEISNYTSKLNNNSEIILSLNQKTKYFNFLEGLFVLYNHNKANFDFGINIENDIKFFYSKYFPFYINAKLKLYNINFDFNFGKEFSINLIIPLTLG
ncbi:MAG: hypothetical protein AABZ74_01865 [Cyanobacteriota bacterium]